MLSEGVNTNQHDMEYVGNILRLKHDISQLQCSLGTCLEPDKKLLDTCNTQGKRQYNHKCSRRLNGFFQWAEFGGYSA